MNFCHIRADSIQMRHNNRLYFLMFVLLDIVQKKKLHTQLLKLSPPLFFTALEVFKEKSKEMNKITRN
jgi:hypothetical protein